MREIKPRHPDETVAVLSFVSEQTQRTVITADFEMDFENKTY